MLWFLLTACAPSEPFAVAVISFEPGETAGFGQDLLPDVVLGPPRGAGPDAGSLDVLSLGRGGSIVLELGQVVEDGPGPDLLVFENAFTGFTETGIVSVSEDAETFVEWPCSTDGTGCAGMSPTLSHPDNDIDPHDPLVAGGDAFDLADIGVERAVFVRIQDTGDNSYGGISGGFDLDAVTLTQP